MSKGWVWDYRGLIVDLGVFVGMGLIRGSLGDESEEKISDLDDLFSSYSFAFGVSIFAVFAV